MQAQTNATPSKPEPSHYVKWREIMKAYETSGVSQLEYCERQGHSFRQFKYYRSRFSQLSKGGVKKVTASLSSPASFTRVSISKAITPGLRIELGGGAYCVMQSPAEAVLVKALLAGLR